MTSDNINNQIVNLARKAIEEYVQNGKKINKVKNDLPEEFYQKKRGTFVSIKKNGNLRGCIGTVEPTQENVVQEIIRNAVNACSHDPRFPAVSSEELDNLTISVDILGEKEPVNSLEELDPSVFGVIVQKGHQTGLLLPDLEGINTPEEQVSIAKKKAGISPGENVENLNLYRFKVKRYE